MITSNYNNVDESIAIIDEILGGPYDEPPKTPLITDDQPLPFFNPQPIPDSERYDHILKAVQLLVDPNYPVEIRIPGTGYKNSQTFAGYFDDSEKFAKAALMRNKKGASIFFTLNPVLPDLLARANNRVKGPVKKGETTTDNEIVRRRWLPIDIDPVRPKGISSTDAEHTAAYEKACEIIRYLSAHNFPLPIIADSGNGVHILYRIDLLNDDDSRDLLREFLHHLSDEFTDDKVDIDTTVFNASRIFKLYGTTAIKGDTTADRPHRDAQLIEVPETIEVLDAGTIRSIIPIKPAQNPSQPKPTNTVTQTDQQLLDKMFGSKSGPKIQALWNGDTSGYKSKSEAVAALCSYLAWWTNRDPVRVEQLFRQSNFEYKKWDEKRGNSTYGQNEIERAIDNCQGGYDPQFASIPQQEVEYDRLAPVRINEPIPYMGQPTVLKAMCRSDVGCAELLELIYNGRLVYDHSSKSWYVWNGHHWDLDRNGFVRRTISVQLSAQFDMLRTDILQTSQPVNGGISDEVKDLAKEIGKMAGSLRRMRGLKPVMEMAQSWLGVTGDEWDSQSHLLGVPNGVLDIKTGALSNGQPTDYIRTTTDTKWGGLNAPCPLWERVVNEAMLNDLEVVAYLQKTLGYALVGTTEQAIFPCLVGDGRNGKSVIIEAVKRVLGDYAHVASEDLIIQKHKGYQDAASPSLAGLQGKRFVTVSETREGAILNNAQVKLATGGDTIKGRMLHSNPVEFIPTHTLFLITNHKPHVKADDYAAWRRVKAIEFKATFVNKPTQPNEYLIDESIPEQLKAEDSGILAWLVRGYQMYMNAGYKLIEPKTVQTATSSYRDEEDTVLEFVNEKCDIADHHRIKCSELYSYYKLWVETNGYGKPMSNRSFARRIVKMGYERTASKSNPSYIGLKY